jgi:hypothetical protein
MEHESLAVATLPDLVSRAAQARRLAAAIDDDRDVARIAGYADELDAEIRRRGHGVNR